MGLKIFFFAIFFRQNDKNFYYLKVEDLLFHKNKGFDKENAHEIIFTLKIIVTWYLTKPAQNVTFNHQFQIPLNLEN